MPAARKKRTDACAREMKATLCGHLARQGGADQLRSSLRWPLPPAPGVRPGRLSSHRRRDRRLRGKGASSASHRSCARSAGALNPVALTDRAWSHRRAEAKTNRSRPSGSGIVGLRRPLRRHLHREHAQCRHVGSAGAVSGGSATETAGSGACPLRGLRAPPPRAPPAGAPPDKKFNETRE